MKREIREKRNKLRETSIRMKKAAWECDFDEIKNLELREKQNDQYKRYKFFDGFIKANDKVKEQ